jgi:hypothetical protein
MNLDWFMVKIQKYQQIGIPLKLIDKIIEKNIIPTWYIT